MRIATFNIWNSTVNWNQRLSAIIDELARLDADIVALQEAPVFADKGRRLTEVFAEQTQYRNVVHLEYSEIPEDDERPEGLVFLSKFPFKVAYVNWADDVEVDNSWAASIAVDWQGALLRVTNLHLDWKRKESRERHTLRIIRDLDDDRRFDYDVLCGDFNDQDDSTVARFLTGSTVLHGMSTSWRDVVEEVCNARGEAPPPTIDFVDSPRAGEARRMMPRRFDRIYVRTGDSLGGINVLDVGSFADRPAERLGTTPSDHLGVYVDFDAIDC